MVAGVQHLFRTLDSDIWAIVPDISFVQLAKIQFGHATNYFKRYTKQLMGSCISCSKGMQEPTAANINIQDLFRNPTTTSVITTENIRSPDTKCRRSICETHEIDSRVVGDYQLLSIIGSGTQSVVYRAEHTHTHRNVAVKIAKRASSCTNELTILESLRHPHVCKLIETIFND